MQDNYAAAELHLRTPTSRASFNSDSEPVSQSASAITLNIPPIYHPFIARAHPEINSINQESLNFMERHGFCPDARTHARINARRTELFSCYCSPDGITERLQIFADWCVLGHILDDTFDTSESRLSHDLTSTTMMGLFAQVIRIFETADPQLLPSDTRLAPALADIARRLHAVASPVQMRRLTHGTRDWLFGTIWETVCQNAQKLCSLSDYVMLRLLSVGGVYMAHFLDVISGEEVPSHDMEAPPIRALTEIAGTLLGIGQDVFSYGKEQCHISKCSALPLNYITVIANEMCCDSGSAIHKAVELHNSIMALFVKLRHQVQTEFSPHTQRYLVDLEYYICAQLNHVTNSPLYTENDGTAITMKFQWTNTAPDKLIAPPSIPSIRWWWGQLV